MKRNKKPHNLRIGATLAALALTAAVCPAQAQFNNIAGFNPSGPRILAPLGGGVIAANAFATPTNSGLNFNNGLAFNPVFSAGFNTGFNPGFSTGFTGTNAALTDYNAQLAAFNAQRTAFDSQFTRFSNVNSTSANFNNAPRNIVLSGGNFSQMNPTFNPFLVNGSVNGNLAFNGFNTFNPLTNNFSAFVGTGIPVFANAITTQAFVNNQANTQQRVFRAKPAFNPTLPNPPASAYPTAAQLASVGAMSSNTQAATSTTYPWPIQPPPSQQSRYQYYILGSGSQAATSQAATSQAAYPWPVQPPPSQQSRYHYYILNPGASTSATQAAYPWPVQPPPSQQSRYQYYILGQQRAMNTGSGVLAGPRFNYPTVVGSPGVVFEGGRVSGNMIMGGRAAR